MPECDSCEGHVSPNFVRVFGIDGTVIACLNCATVPIVRAQHKRLTEE